MNYPRLSLEQDLIDDAFSGVKRGIKKEPKQHESPSERVKRYHKKQKELKLQNDNVDECDQCEYKTSKYQALYRHKRENHYVAKIKCPDCEYSNIYPNRVKRHYNQVHRGMKRKQRSYLINEKCRRESCEFAGTKNCLELQSHSLFFCDECQLSFKRNDDLKYHNDKIHEGLVFNCEYCETYSTARKRDLTRHMHLKHTEEGHQSLTGVC